MDPIEQNIQGVQQLVGSKLNKSINGALSMEEGAESERKDELDIDLTNEELIDLARKIEIEYAPYEALVNIRQKANLTYYLGKQKSGSPQATEGTVVSDNEIFQATETLLLLPCFSQAKNPEPVVSCRRYQKKEISFRLTLKSCSSITPISFQCVPSLTFMVRKWMADFLAVIKHGWDREIGDIIDDVRDVKNFIFDPNGYVDVYGNFVGILGERIKSTAQELCDEFPKHEGCKHYHNGRRKNGN